MSFNSDYNTDEPLCQERQEVKFLSDKTERGKERPWRVHKLNSQYISIAYEQVNMNKAERIMNCAETLLFRRENGKMRLKQANFCRVRLCPMCSWRRSLKTHAHMERILGAAKPLGYRYLMCTFTLRNCSGDELIDTLSLLIDGYKKLVRRKRVKDAWNGWYRGIEVTHNLRDDTYHPHIHALVAVDKSYFKSKKYISQDELTEIWRSCCGIDYKPIVDIRRTYGDDVRAVSEVAKYSTKAGDIICFDDWDLTVDTVRVLDAALADRRLIAFGGKFKELHKQLNLDDTEDGDLINVADGADELTDVADELLFWWHTGYAQYVR